jgi:Outer membrane protein beta-barrel domain
MFKKKSILPILLSILCLNTSAQFHIGTSVGIHHSYLYNKSDVAADATLDYVNTFKGSVGLVLGYQVSPKLTLQIQPQYYTAGQKFTGVPPVFMGISSLASHIRLKYLQLPLLINIGLTNPNRKTQKYLQIGGYFSQLLSYKQTVEYNYSISPTNNLSYGQIATAGKEIDYTLNFKTINGDSMANIQYILNKPRFNAQDYGVMLGYGMQFSINKSFSINTAFQVKYGLGQVDNKDTIVSTYVKDPNIYIKETIADWVYCRNNITGGLPGQAARNPNSNNIFTGLQISFIYHLGSKKASSFN